MADDFKKTMVTVVNNNPKVNDSKGFYLYEGATLKEIRNTLTADTSIRMQATDAFINNEGADFDKNSEADINLKDFLDGAKTLVVGHEAGELDPADPNRVVNTYQDLSSSQRKTLLEKMQVFNGLTMDENGFDRSGKNVVSYDIQNLKPNLSNISTLVKSDYSFTKVTHEMKVADVESASVSLDTPYGGGEAEYKSERTKSTSSSEVEEFLLSKYMVNKIELSIEEDQLKVTDEFYNAVKNAVNGKLDSVDGYTSLLRVLKDYGFYVVNEFTLGGVLFSTETTKISSFEEAETKKDEFTASFKAEFEGIGGGAGYSNAHSTEESSSQTATFTNLTITQIGGLPGTQNDYNEWMRSLDSAQNWAIASFNNLTPSLALIWDKDETLVANCMSLIKTYYWESSVRNLQAVLDMGQYASQVEDYNIPPF